MEPGVRPTVVDAGDDCLEVNPRPSTGCRLSEPGFAPPRSTTWCSFMTAPPLTIGQCASLACLLEATAPKPGNVHRGADFEDVTYLDFAVSAVAIQPAVEAAAAGAPLGRSVLAAVAATHELVGTNTNLGMLLLFVPLAKAPHGVPLGEGIAQVLAGLTADDARDVYAAIRLAHPGGLGRVAEADVAAEPPRDLLSAMRLAAERDAIARQYANGFDDVLSKALPWLVEGQRRGWSLLDAIVHAHLRLMSELPDTLIARKCGGAVAQQAADRAAEVLRCGAPGDEEYHRALGDLDFWLRGDGHRRNPGTTADLIAAGLFAGLREGTIRVEDRGRQGMAVARLDGSTIVDWPSFHEQCAREFGFPDFYGRNMNAWIDCLTYLPEGDGMSRFVLGAGEKLLIEVANGEEFRQRLPEIHRALVECTEFVNRRYRERAEEPRLELVFR